MKRRMSMLVAVTGVMAAIAVGAQGPLMDLQPYLNSNGPFAVWYNYDKLDDPCGWVTVGGLRDMPILWHLYAGTQAATQPAAMVVKDAILVERAGLSVGGAPTYTERCRRVWAIVENTQSKGWQLINTLEQAAGFQNILVEGGLCGREAAAKVRARNLALFGPGAGGPAYTFDICQTDTFGQIRFFVPGGWQRVGGGPLPALPPPASVLSPGGSGGNPLPKPHVGIKVAAATYGANCPGTSRGNKTTYLAQACDGKQSCQYQVWHYNIGDPAFGCRKNFIAEWTCNEDTTVRRAEAQLKPEHAGEAGSGAIVSLSCGG